MARFEFRSRNIECDRYAYGDDDKLQRLCNDWAADGFVVFSIVCPDPRNYLVFRVTARKDNEASFTPPMFEETR